jgi:ABC transporter substrate binding protein (PQQ-dependent alcohol dehydrogenase system)
MHLRAGWIAAIGLVLWASLVSATHATSYKAVLLVPQDDARLERTRLERAYLGQPGGSAIDGVKAALGDAKLELESAGTSLAIEVVPVATPQAAADAARKAEQGGAVALLTDLGAAGTVAATDAVKLPVINIGEADDALRGASCRARLLHVAPSERMRTDALAQNLVARKWTNVLLLRGPSPRDAERAATALASIKRYGLKLAAERPFKLSNDPRERDLANVVLLTQGSHDVVWVVDSEGEFARHVPHRTATPRPVVGDAGLVALAWHAQYDRYGATQLSRRFQRGAQRPITAPDWQAWMAGKALVAAALAAPKGPAAAFHKALADVEIDGSKGVNMAFRPWDGQLRQTMLLTDGQGVVGMAPVDGVLHAKNNLDTLGADAPEKLCKAR